MERLDMSAKESQTGKECSKDSSGPDDGVTESKACPDLHRDLTDLTSQVQMMSDSLAACRQMPRYRPLRKACDVAAGATPRTSRPALPPAEKTAPSGAWRKDTTVSCATARTNGAKQLRRWNGDLGQESVSAGDLRPADAWRLRRDPAGGADAGHVAALIQKELTTLGLLAPSVSLLAAVLSDAIFRYAGCRTCSKRISSCLPWILNRIQELIVYVATRRTCSYGFRQPQPTAREIKKPAEEKSAEEPAPAEIAKSQKVDASDASGARPGVQILLQVKAERQKKRLFQTVDLQPPQRQANLCFVQVHESASVPVVHVVKPRRQPQVLGETRKDISRVKEYSFGVCLLLRYCTRTAASVLEPTPVDKAVFLRKARETLDLRAVGPFEEQTLQWKKNSLTVFTRKTLQAAPAVCGQEKNVPAEVSTASPRGSSWLSSDKKEAVPPGGQYCPGNPAGSQRKPPLHGSNERRSYGLSDFLANAPDLVKELLKEAEEEKMEIQKLKVGVNGLKDLMLEVHRNQIELSRFLLENGILSPPIIKLTNPHMLEEETAALRRLEDSLAGKGSRSAESLQGEIEELRERCIMKNQMVMSLVKGLQSDVPPEWWEEMMTSFLGPSEEIDYERFSEGYGFSLANNEQASRKTTHCVEQPSEEEPIARGKVGEDIKEDLSSGLQDWQSQCRIWAFPALHFPKEVNTSILKLENQISLLNVENEKLWNEVHELKDQLAGSVEQLSERRQSAVISHERPPGTGKTINLTIHIATEKSARPSVNTEFQNESQTEDAGSRDNISESSPVVSVTDLDAQAAGTLTPLATKPKFHLKSSRGLSQNELRSVEDAWRREKPGRNAAFARGVGQREQQVPAGHGCPLLQRPGGAPAGPSGKRVERVLRAPPPTGPAEDRAPGARAATPNERRLRLILENERAGPSTPAAAAGQTIQRLRTRVRSIHKEVALLKLKNVRIEKLLDRLVEDAVYNNHRSFEETQHNLRDFTARLD